MLLHLGHCHPKISEAVSYWAKKLMNAHDFTTPVKEKLMEKMADILPGKLNAIQLYSDGTAAVEAAIRAARAITNKHEFISAYRDFHGKTMGAVSCAQMYRGETHSYGPTRAAGFYMVPAVLIPIVLSGPKPMVPLILMHILDFMKILLKKEQLAMWQHLFWNLHKAGQEVYFPPDDFFPKLKKLCDKYKILLYDDEVLAGMGRTGEWLTLNHWGVIPDIVTFGKSFGNGFPVTAMVVSEENGEALEKISASSSYGGNPMACAAALGFH